MKERICGIYVIEAISGNPKKIGWKYVGKSTTCNKRLSKHRRMLFYGTHNNPKLQTYYNKYGEKSLKFFLLKILPNDWLDFYERFFIKMFDSKVNGFNCSDGGDNPPPPKPKKCKMQHILTGEIVESNSRDEFAEKYGVPASQVSRVMLGKLSSTGLWFCPEHKWRPKIYKVISPEGQIFDVFRSSVFCREHNIPDSVTFSGLLRNKLCSCHGWTLVGGKRPEKSGKIIKKFKIIGPNNQIYEGDNILQCAKKLNIESTNLNGVINGKKRICQGWTLYKETQ